MSFCRTFLLRLQLTVFLIIFQELVKIQAQECRVVLTRRTSCGSGTEEQCEQRGCCYDGDVPNGFPRCYFRAAQAPTFRDWGNWSECTSSCGETGTRTRERNCEYPDGRPAPVSVCIGSNVETEPCNRRACQNTGSSGGSSGGSTGGSTVGETAASSGSAAGCRNVLGACGRFGQFCEASGTLGNSIRMFCSKTCGTCEDGPAVPTPAVITTTSTTTETQPVLKYELSQCIDEFPDTCNRVLELCNDPKYINDTRLYCRQTCNLCSTPAPSCEDRMPNRCSQLSSFCNQREFRSNCPRTCNACSETSKIELVPTVQTASEAVNSAVITTMLSTTTPEIITTVLTATTSQPTTTPAECRDEATYCGAIARHCDDSQYAPARAKCQATCGLCTSQTTSNVARSNTILFPPSTTRQTSTSTAVLSPTTTQSTTTSTTAPATTTTATEPTDTCRDELHYCSEITVMCGKELYREQTKGCKRTCNMCETTATTAPTQPAPTNTSAKTAAYTTDAITVVTRTILLSTEEPDGGNTKACKDKNPRCQEVVRFCGSGIYVNLLRDTCKLSCGYCNDTGETSSRLQPANSENTGSPTNSTSTEVSPECQDKFPLCSTFTGDALCDAINTLKVNCPTSCNSCVNGVNPHVQRVVPTRRTTITRRPRRTTTTRRPRRTIPVTPSPTPSVSDPNACKDRFPSICARYSDEACQRVQSLRRGCARTCGVCSDDDE